MKVAVYSGSIPSTVFIERLVEALAEKGLEVILHGRISARPDYSTKRIKVIGYRSRFDEAFVAARYLLLFMLLRPQAYATLRRCYTTTSRSKSFWRWFLEVGPILWHQPDVFHLQWTKSLEDWLFLQEFGVRIVASLRGAHINYSPITDPDLAEMYRRTFPRVDAFHAVSELIAEKAASYGAKSGACKVIYSGLRLEEFEFRNDPTDKTKSLDILSVGRPHWVKGYHIALDALAHAKSLGLRFHYTIVGGEMEELVFQSHDLGLEDSVSFEKPLPFADVKDRIRQADVLLLTSVDEGVPNVVLEAMALGTIVVSSACGGVPEVLVDAGNGFVAPNRDPSEIANRLMTVGGLSSDEAERIRKRARQTVEERHRIESMVEEMISLYRSVTDDQ